DSPPAKEQVAREAFDDIKGLGRLFLPAMTHADNEPVFRVFNAADSAAASGKMGTSLWLRPGKYTILMGSGSVEQLIEKKVEIYAEDTTILPVDWCGLSVNVIDEYRNAIRESYEVYALPDYEYYGVGYGVDEQQGERVQTWVLRPGLYKLIKQGEHVNSFRNFTTVRLLPGELAHFTIVMNESNDIVGAGILDFGQKPLKLKNWTFYSGLYGSFTLNSSNDTDNTGLETSMILVGQFDYKIRYSTAKHNFLSRGLVEEGWNIQKEQSRFRTNLDRLQMNNVYIYNVRSRFGVYSRLWFETNLFEKNDYFDDHVNLTLFDENDIPLDTLYNVDEFRTSKIMSPFEMKEGLGLNLILLQQLRANLNVRVGYGWNQLFTNKLYTVINDSTYRLKPSVYDHGPEASVVGTARLFRNMQLSSEFQIFYPLRTQDRVDYELETIINWKLSQNLSLNYTLRFRDKQNLSDHILTDHILLLRFNFFPF
ncbi:DUF3078 domain-containing protein, partial [bacterium]|nr:DUF3078 domain-containing protein [bacterium]